MSNGWVDPRSDPKPPAVRVQGRVARDAVEIADLLTLCRTGRIYGVERWILEGKPIQVAHCGVNPWGSPPTPLTVAIESGQYDLAFLLLCNGYQTRLEPRSPLGLALERRAWDYVELLLEWGADPQGVDPGVVLDTYNSALIERFWKAGLDYTRGRRLARYLAESTRNLPAYGWAKRHNDLPAVVHALTLALVDAVGDNREKAVSLLMWAGADPHRAVPNLGWGSDDEDDPEEDRQSAVECAVEMGHGKLLRALKADPEKDRFPELFARASDPDAVDYLVARYRPSDWSAVIVRNICLLSWWFPDLKPHRQCLEKIFGEYGGRLCTLERRECWALRKEMLRLDPGDELCWLLRTLAKPEHCDPAIFAELTRTPAMTRHLENMGMLRRRKIPLPVPTRR